MLHLPYKCGKAAIRSLELHNIVNERGFEAKMTVRTLQKGLFYLLAKIGNAKVSFLLTQVPPIPS